MHLGNLDRPRKWGTNFEWQTWEGPVTVLTGQTLPLWALGGTPTRANVSQSVASAGQSLLLQALWTYPSRGGRPSPLYEWVREPQTAATSAPSHLDGKRIPESGAYLEAGAKPKMIPRGSASKEEEWQFHMWSCLNCRFNSCNWLDKSCFCGISEKISVPITETSLASVVLDVRGKYTWGLASLVAQMVKAPVYNEGDLGSIPGSGRSPEERKWQSTPVFLPGESHGLRILVGYSPWGCKEWDTTEQLHYIYMGIGPSQGLNWTHSAHSRNRDLPRGVRGPPGHQRALAVARMLSEVSGKCYYSSFVSFYSVVGAVVSIYF